MMSLEWLEMHAADSVDVPEAWEDDLQLEEHFASMPRKEESIWRKRASLMRDGEWQLSNWQRDTTMTHTLRRTWGFAAGGNWRKRSEVEAGSTCEDKAVDDAMLESPRQFMGHRVFWGVFRQVWNSFAQIPSIVLLMVGLMLILAIDFVRNRVIPVIKLAQIKNRRAIGRAIEQKALTLMKEKDFVRAVDELHKGLESLTKAEEVDTNDLAALTYLLAKSFMVLAKWSAAESCLYRVEEIYTYTSDDTGAALVYEDLSIVFEAQHRDEEAAKMRWRADEMNEIQSALYDDENSDEEEEEEENEDSVWRTSPAKPIQKTAMSAPAARNEAVTEMSRKHEDEDEVVSAILVEVPLVRAYSIGTPPPSPSPAPAPTSSLKGGPLKRLSLANKENDNSSFSSSPRSSASMAIKKGPGERFVEGGRRRARSGLSPLSPNVR